MTAYIIKVNPFLDNPRLQFLLTAAERRKDLQGPAFSVIMALRSFSANIALYPGCPERQQEVIKLNKNVKTMVGLSLLIALIIVLQFISGMIPPVGGFSISLVLIPIVVGAAVYGPGAGALLGGAFGVIVAINCINGTDLGGAMVFQANPALCILVVLGKGILAGLAAGWVYKLLKSTNAYLAMLCCAIVCPVVNTGVFIACMLTFFKDVLAVWAGGDIVAYILTGLVLANFVPELIINVVFGTAGQGLLKAIKK